MIDLIDQIESLLPQALAVDRHNITRQIAGIKPSRAETKPDQKTRKKLWGLQKQLKASIRKKTWRQKNRPTPSYPPTLPITAYKDEIVDAITKNQVVIISGETGSGKTTQIPKFCLDAGRGIDGKIGCTQPRRIAAMTVCRRIAEELGEEPGGAVGFKIRFKDNTGPKAFVKIMTDGILLAETQNDPYLNEYDTIIVDEAHERSLNIDFILGFLKTLIKRRRDLKLVITSATIDTEKFSKAFDRAPVIEVSGRMYPVEVRYFSDNDERREGDSQTYIEAAVRALDALQQETASGDVLIFMPTEQDIRETCELIRGRHYKSAVVMPLFARLSTSEQSRVFAEIAARKIIVATNVAETSITIPGIKYVIDTGLARISRYTPRTRTTSLPVTAISQSSAEQRKGRCGRVENGICIRLFSEQDFISRPLYTPPEILRANLAEVILRMIALKLGDIAAFPFVDRPETKSIRDGFNLLVELGAIVPDAKPKKSGGEKRYKLTKTGKVMARMPIDPRLTRMLVEAGTRGCIKDVTVIAAALSIQDPRERPAEKAEIADQTHRAFHDPASDFITLLNIWKQYQQTWHRAKTTSQKFKQAKQFCKTHFLSFKRMREWIDIHGQLTQILKDYRLRDRRIAVATAQDRNPKDSEYTLLYAAIHKSILSGLLSNIAVKKEQNLFQAAKGREAMIFPGSALFNKAKTWIVAAEMVETTRLFARTTANIESGWLEELGRDLCKYTYLDPHWEKNRGEVVVYEQVSLFGLIIVPRRKVSYGKINRQEASDIFIRSALVADDVKQKFPFMDHNRQLINTVEDMEDRIRRRDILVSETDMYEFYQKRLQGCYDIRSLRRRIEQKGGDRFLRMKPENIRRYLPAEEELGRFPDRLELGNQTFDCTYTFQPGETGDGVTVNIPSSQAARVPPESMDWLVPGLYGEKIEALIKGLPKAYRKQLVPVPETVAIIVNEMPKDEGPLITALSRFIYRRFKVDIPASAWSEDHLPQHLKMRIAITDHKGQELIAGRDTAILRQSFSGQSGPQEFSAIESARKQWERDGITQWDFADLPEAIEIDVPNHAKWVLYPGLVKASSPNQKSVNLRLFQQQDEALKSHKEGVAVLLVNHFAKDLKFLKKTVTLPREIRKAADYFGGAGRFENMLYESVIKGLFVKNIRSKEAFDAHAASVSPIMLDRGRDLLEQSTAVLRAYHDTRSVLYQLESAHSASATARRLIENLRTELARLVPETFAGLYDAERLLHLPRYIEAVSIRAQRALVDFEKDKIKAEEIRIFKESLDKILQALSPKTSQEKKSAVEEYFWLIEEYKVSVFAQELKTAVPVSPKRLADKLKEIERMV